MGLGEEAHLPLSQRFPAQGKGHARQQAPGRPPAAIGQPCAAGDKLQFLLVAHL